MKEQAKVKALTFCSVEKELVDYEICGSECMLETVVPQRGTVQV